MKRGAIRYGDSHRNKNQVYTYFVVDMQNDIVKVGESRRPDVTFRQLRADIEETPRHRTLALWGVRDSVSMSERVIRQLWARARTTHPVPHAGCTEWFSMNDELVDLCLGMIGAGRDAMADEFQI